MSNITVRYLRTDIYRTQAFLDSGVLLKKEASYVTDATVLTAALRAKIAEMWGIEGDYWVEDFRKDGRPRLELPTDITNGAEFATVINKVYAAYKQPKVPE